MSLKRVDYFITNFNEPDGSETWAEEVQGLVPNYTIPIAVIDSSQLHTGIGSLFLNGGWVEYSLPVMPTSYTYDFWFRYNLDTAEEYRGVCPITLGDMDNPHVCWFEFFYVTFWNIGFYDSLGNYHHLYEGLETEEEYEEIDNKLTALIPDTWINIKIVVDTSSVTVKINNILLRTWYVENALINVNYLFWDSDESALLWLDDIAIYTYEDVPDFAEPVGRYNEGDHMAYAPGDSGGTAVWKEASSSPVPITPTHRPGCGYWFQVEGTVYGGEVGAWIPWNVDQKVEFNEGSKITKSPRVSGGSPIWKVNQSGPAITETHAPCGYWFKDYDSNSQLYRICFGLEMGYTKTNMVVDEQQTLYVKDSNGDTVDCQITTWTLDGVGSLSNSVGPTTVYTAPDYSEAGADSATITLWCGGAVKDTLVISIAHSCDCLDTIVYTSLQMSVNQQQTLSASGMQSDECYSWAITGGGSLLPLTGKSVVYTAPATNANCLSNPTITLSCGGVVIDTLKLAVSSGAGTYYAYVEHYTQSSYDCQQGIGYRFRNCLGSITLDGRYCDGCDCSMGDDDCNCGGGFYCTPEGLLARCEANNKCGTWSVDGIQVPLGCTGVVDTRTLSDKATGCCPAALLL